MVDVKELRIGNIVYVRCQDGEHTVESIEKKDGWTGGYKIHMANGLKSSLDYIMPIPLTEELLLKCGFETEHYGFSNVNIELSYGCFLCGGISQDYDVGLFVSTNGAEYAVSNEIKYLHQLQNIYYALTGKELEIIL